MLKKLFAGQIRPAHKAESLMEFHDLIIEDLEKENHRRLKSRKRHTDAEKGISEYA